MEYLISQVIVKPSKSHCADNVDEQKIHFLINQSAPHMYIVLTQACPIKRPELRTQELVILANHRFIVSEYLSICKQHINQKVIAYVTFYQHHLGRTYPKKWMEEAMFYHQN